MTWLVVGLGLCCIDWVDCSLINLERAIRLDRNGNVVGLREGEEKVLVSCGIGENKKSQIVTVKVIKESLLNQLIDDLISKYEIIVNRIVINLTWSSLKEIYKYDIYMRNNYLGDTNYKVVESILMDKIDLDSQNKIKTTIELDIADLKGINLDFYVVGVTDNGNTEVINCLLKAGADPNVVDEVCCFWIPYKLPYRNLLIWNL